MFYNNGRPFSVHKKIEGTPLAEKMNEMSDSDIDKVSSQISEFMSDMHKLECKETKAIDSDNISLNLSGFLDELLKLQDIDLKIRKLIIKNYIIFYRVNEEENIVNIERILYSASNWINEL